MGRTKFYQKIRALLNLSPRGLIRAVHIKKAAYHLVVEGFSVSEAAVMLCINSQSNFIKSFKKTCESTPAQYIRESHHKNKEANNELDISNITGSLV